ncbi:hypothetical protein EDWATA_04061 [Edwardsiella tarda ATCC 23685]|uniref:Uncharacterized protein n=1 Tax=Edwardsiella tarda ATCC 23685 TaxID=500638 RepID=D4FB90_EDWTA|nr:hypothetical protein EDWATA_04061 [Edwardsiella tarda ATCC 23685]
MKDVCWEAAISEATDDNWKSKYGDMESYALGLEGHFCIWTE